MSARSAGTPAATVAVDSAAGRTVIATTVLGSAVAMLTSTAIGVALPSIARELDATTSHQQWIVNGYLLMVGSLILIGGSLGDRLGRVRVYRVGVAWFAAASLLSALAPSIEVLIVAQVLQGIGGALLVPGSLAIIEATLRPEDRGKGVGRWAGLTAVAVAAGPLVGGLLVEASWRWVFVLNLPVAAGALLLSVRVPESSDASARGSSLDWVGAVLAVLALGGMSLALIQGPEGGWGAGDVIAGAVGMTAAVLLVVWEPRCDHPMVPFGLFANRPFAAANAITLVVYGGMGIVFFLLSIHLQVTVGWSPLAAGAAVLPATGLLLVMSSRAGDLAQRIGPRIPLSVGPLLIAGGMLLYMRIGPGASYVTDVLPGVVVFGIGLGISVAPVTATALGSVPDTRSGAASGANNAIARTGQSLAVAAVPPLVGLTGEALNEPNPLDAGFPEAMVVAAYLVASGALIALLFLRSRDLGGDEREAGR